MRTYFKRQSEVFDINQNILDNLEPDEKIIYKLNLKYFSKMQLMLIATIIYFPIFVLVILVIRLFNQKGFNETDFLFLLFPIVLPIIIKFVRHRLEFSIYLTTRNIFVLNEIEHNDIAFDVIPLNSIKWVTSEVYSSKNYGTIEFVRKSAENFNFTDKVITKEIREVSKLMNIIESILWEYGEVDRKLEQEKFKNIEKNVLKFHESKNNSTLQLFENKIIFLKESNFIEINFDRDLNFNNEGKYVILNQNSDINSKTIMFGPVENYSEILESFFLLYLSWKKNQILLLEKTSLNNLESKNFVPITKPNYEDISFNPPQIQIEDNDRIKSYLQDNEKVLTTNFPKRPNIDLKLILYSIAILTGFYFLTIYFIHYILIFYLTLGIIFFLILYFTFQSHSKFFFTPNKMIILRKNDIEIVPYSNIIAITVCLLKKNQAITIHLKEPVIRGGFSMYIVELFFPVELNMFNILLKLKKKS